MDQAPAFAALGWRENHKNRAIQRAAYSARSAADAGPNRVADGRQLM